jgi:hypothetical protein
MMAEWLFGAAAFAAFADVDPLRSEPVVVLDNLDTYENRHAGLVRIPWVGAIALIESSRTTVPKDSVEGAPIACHLIASPKCPRPQENGAYRERWRPIFGDVRLRENRH